MIIDILVIMALLSKLALILIICSSFSRFRLISEGAHLSMLSSTFFPSWKYWVAPKPSNFPLPFYLITQ